MSLKNPVTSPGIDPGTVGQRHNHFATAGPAYVLLSSVNINIYILSPVFVFPMMSQYELKNEACFVMLSNKVYMTSFKCIYLDSNKQIHVRFMYTACMHV